MKLSNSFLLSLTGLAILAVLGWRGADVATPIVMLVTGYVAARQAGKSSHVWAASKDPSANTDEIIEKLK